jgi:hypothetical protein
MSFPRKVFVGTVAAAVGTVLLDVVTYADMAVRGRPPSAVPGTMVKNLAEYLGLEELAADDETAANRRSGIAALLGYANGLAVGAIYCALDPVLGKLPLTIRALLAGGAAMAAADVLAAKSGATDPKTWGTAGWLSDIVPHVVFGYAVACTFDALDDEVRGSQRDRHPLGGPEQAAK